MMNLRLSDPARRAELRELLLDAQREGTGYGNTHSRWRTLFGDPMPGEDDVILVLLDALDAAEARAAPLVWRRMTGKEIKALPDGAWCWLRWGSDGPARAASASYARDLAYRYQHATDPSEWQIAGPIPEPISEETPR